MLIKFKVAAIRDTAKGAVFTNALDGQEYKVGGKIIPFLQKWNVGVGSAFLANVNKGYLNDALFNDIVVPFVPDSITMAEDGSATLYNQLARDFYQRQMEKGKKAAPDAAECLYVAPEKVPTLQQLGVGIGVPMMVSLSCATTAEYPAIKNVFAVGEQFARTREGNPVGYAVGTLHNVKKGQYGVKVGIKISRKDEVPDFVNISASGQVGEALLALEASMPPGEKPRAVFDIAAHGTRKEGRTGVFVTYSAKYYIC